MGMDMGAMRRSYEDTGHVYSYTGFLSQFPMNFDPDEQIRKSGVERNIAAFKAGDPSMAPAMDVISSHPDLEASFGRLCEAEGAGVQDFGKMMEGEGAIDAADFEEMMNNPAMRQHLVQVMDRTAASDDLDVEDMTNYLRAASRAAESPNQANIQQWMGQASAFGLENEAQQLQSQAAMAGGLGSIQDFLNDPTRALFDMGLDPELIAMLEPFLKFFTEAAGYYMNGDGNQPGLIEIFGNATEQTHARAAEIRAQYGNEAPEQGSYALNERGEVVQVVAMPGTSGPDIDPDRPGIQRPENLVERNPATVTVDEARGVAYKEVGSFDSLGASQIVSELRLAPVFGGATGELGPTVEPGADRTSDAAAEFSSGVRGRALGMGG